MKTQRITQKQIGYSLSGNLDRNAPFHIEAENARGVLEEGNIISEGHSLEGLMVAPGTQVISAIENCFEGLPVLSYDAAMRSPVLVPEEGKELYYDVDIPHSTMADSETIDFKISATPFGREDDAEDPDNNLVAKGNVTVYISGDSNNIIKGLEEVGTDSFFEGGFRGYDFHLTQDNLEDFCKSIGMDIEIYMNKYGNSISPVFGAYLLVDPMVKYGHDVEPDFKRQCRELFSQKEGEAPGEIDVSYMYGRQAMYSNPENLLDISSGKLQILTKTVKSKPRYRKGAIMDNTKLCSFIPGRDRKPALIGIASALRFARKS